jgi:hypothetical protein
MDAGADAVGTTFAGGGGVGGDVAALTDAQVAANSAGISQQGAVNSLASQSVQSAATNPSWYSKALDYITPSSDLAKYGAITAGANVVGGVLSGIGQQQAAEEQRQAMIDQRNYEAEQLRIAQEKRNANMGAELWAPDQYAAYAPPVAPKPAGLAARYMTQPTAA